MAERKLATIRRVSRVDDIPGKDRIGLAHIDGWTVIVQKADILPGSLCVFCEIDSLLPSDAEWCSFLKDKHIRSMKMSGCISQGIAFPLSILPDGLDVLEGDDVTEILGVTKWERPDAEDVRMPTTSNKKKYPKWLLRMMRKPWFRKIFGSLLTKKQANDFPSFVSKTDEVRCLTSNTKIETAQGKIRIADIVNKRLDVLVKSYDSKKKEIVWKPIVSYQKYPMDPILYEIEYTKDAYRSRKNRLKCTADHKLLSNNQEYKRADEFIPGDSVWYSEECYPDDCVPAIYGMLLGDSSVSFDKRSHKDGSKSLKPRIAFSQGEAQLDYLKDKLAMFGEHRIREGTSGYGDGKIYQAYLPIDYTITNALCRDTIIEDGQFTITKSFCDKLTPLSFAFWYMDDGCIRHNGDGIASPTIQISSNAFSYEENVLLSKALASYGIETTIRTEHKGDNTYYSIYIRVVSVPRFLEMITPYIPECMRYKTLENYRDVVYVLPDIRYEKQNRLIENKVTAVKILSDKDIKDSAFVYDIEVADTHNFFANDILNHNCQNVPWILDKDQEWVVTEKIDGTSGTFAIRQNGTRFGKKKYEYYVCSRNRRIFSDDGSIYWAVYKKYRLDVVLLDMITNWNVQWVCIQGECVGPGVQGNKYQLKEPHFFAFNLITSDVGRWSSQDGQVELAGYSVPWVPILGCEKLPKTVEEMLEKAHGQSAINIDTMREGLVCRSLDGQQSFKAVDPEFLIHYGE